MEQYERPTDIQAFLRMRKANLLVQTGSAPVADSCLCACNVLPLHRIGAIWQAVVNKDMQTLKVLLDHLDR